MNLSFGRPAPTEQTAPSEGAGSERRRLLLVGGGGLAAVAVAGVAAVVLTQGGSGTEVAAASAVGAPLASSTPTASTAVPTGDPTVAEERPVSGADARDPFEPLVTDTTAATTSAASRSVAISSADGTASSATASQTTAAGDPTSSPTTSSPSKPRSTPTWTWKSRSSKATPSPSIRVTVRDVHTDNLAATITVDAKKYTPQVGEVFAKHFRVLTFNDGTCAAIQYGTQEPFDLCEGDTRSIG